MQIIEVKVTDLLCAENPIGHKFLFCLFYFSPPDFPWKFTIVETLLGYLRKAYVKRPTSCTSYHETSTGSSKKRYEWTPTSTPSPKLLGEVKKPVPALLAQSSPKEAKDITTNTSFRPIPTLSILVFDEIDALGGSESTNEIQVRCVNNMCILQFRYFLSIQFS